MVFASRKLAITDIETSGIDPDSHEILEIALLVVDQHSLDVLDTLELKVRPDHIETASATALVHNGYNEADWANAVSLAEALRLYASKTKDAVFCSHNVTFDWGFLARAFSQTRVGHEMDYHRIDLFTAAWALLGDDRPADIRLDTIALHLGIEAEAVPHRALGGARTAQRVLKALLDQQEGRRVMNERAKDDIAIQFERVKVCYEQNCEAFRGLNQLMWQVPVIAMTLTGGLWYGVATLKDMKTIKTLLLLLAALGDVAFIVVLVRVRAVMSAYLDKIKEFNTNSFPQAVFPGSIWSFLGTEFAAKGEKVVVRTFSILLGLAALGSVVAMWVSL